ncbi:MAG: hypothetical protein LBV51_00650 [Acholeplasmatales bacterium]|jgi:4-hydroxy-3-methylbut-2-enyl diphosphate reductase|nr:hypothetical protein [Acholeplasmatales bacterium]
MNIKELEPIGFCKGVKNAIEIVSSLSKEKVFLVSSIVHNKKVNLDLLKNNNVEFLKDDTVFGPSSHNTLVYSAHTGIEKKLNHNIYNSFNHVFTTCNIIKKNYKTALDASKDGKVIFVGKKNHPESEYFKTINNLYLITNCDDLNKLEFDKNDKIYIISQTTYNTELYEKIKNKAAQLYPFLINLGGTCNEFVKRLRSISVLDDCEVLLVIGDTTSSNSIELLEKGKNNKTIKESILIENADDIIKNLKLMKRYQNIAYTSATSASYSDVSEIIDYLKKCLNAI